MTTPRPEDEPEQPDKAQKAQEAQEEAEGEPQEPQEAPPERPQNAWEAAQELLEHAPESFTGQGTFFTGGAPSFGGSLVAGSQHAVSGGRVHGDVVTGHKTTIYQLGAAFGTPLHQSGEIPEAELGRLEAVFQDGPVFERALTELRDSRVLILQGGQDTGRRAAALMLLRRLGARRIRALNPDVPPSALLGGVEPADGYLLADFATPRSRPLREPHLLSLRESLAKQGGHLVITVAESAGLPDCRPLEWRAPEPAAVLAAHLRFRLADPAAIPGLLALEPVAELLGKTRPVREIAEFAERLAEYAAGACELDSLADFGQAAVLEQIGRWFEEPESHLREKAFLLALSVFDKAPYALTAELSDRLYRRLEVIDTPGRREGIPPFGNSIESRLRLARAHAYQGSEQTPWGPVPQRMATFTDPRIAPSLLREVWTSHPSAHPAVVAWIRELAADPRPLVRTRAAATAALLAGADLSSAMGHLLGPWSASRDFRLGLQAANTLALAYHAGTAAVPRILTDWCQDDNAHRRWTAVRGYALLGHLLPDQALEALAVAAGRLDGDELAALAESVPAADPAQVPANRVGFESRGLVEAVELMLLSPAGPEVLPVLVRWASGAPALRHLALAGFLTAAQRTEGDQDDPLGFPLLLRWYAATPAAAPGEVVTVTALPGAGAQPAVRPQLGALWRTALADRGFGAAALRVLRSWVQAAQSDRETETHLGELLHSMAVTERDRQRLSHLLRSAGAGQNPSAPGPADRLLGAVTAH